MALHPHRSFADSARRARHARQQAGELPRVGARFHFTDSRNLPSIRRFGLRSWQFLQDHDVRHFPASNAASRNLDRRAGLQDYVRLCLRPFHPMEYRACHDPDRDIERIMWIVVDPIVIQWKATLFSSDNATSKRARIDADPWTAFASDSEQAEILVKGWIDRRWLRFAE